MDNNLNNFWVKLEKEWFYVAEGDETLLQRYDTIGFTVYSILMRNITTRNTIPVCINSIADILRINKNKNTSFINRIKKAIINMNGENKLFTLYKDTNCNILMDVELNNSTTYYAKLIKEPPKDSFMMLYDNEIDRLIYYAKDKKVSVEDLITHYSFICNGFKGKKENEEDPEGYKCWYGTYESITKKIGLVKNTLVSNNKVFQELNLLLIGNAGGKVEGDKYENTSNIYTKVKDKEYFNKYLEIKKGQINKAFERDKDKAEQNEQRRLKQIYKNYQKKHEIEEVNDCKDGEYEELQQLELAYLNYVKGRDKKLVNANFKTIHLDGTPIKRYVSQDDLEIKNNVNDNEDDNWGGEPPKKDVDDMDVDVVEEENIRKDLFEYIKEQCKGNVNIQEKFMGKFKNSGLKTATGKDLLQLKERVTFFFSKADYLDF